jgi:TDG/mug DNA glycosylase family protein
MDRATVDVYEAGVERYLQRTLRVGVGADAFAAAVPDGRLRLDLGSGPGHMTGALGGPVVAADAAFAMVSRVTATPLRVQADLEALPFRRGCLHGTWASKCMQHVPPERLPMALADLHRTMAVGARLDLVVFESGGTWRSDGKDDLPGRMFWDWPRARLLDVVHGAGFVDATLRTADRDPVVELHVTATRGRTLADVVGPGMRLLLCGLNPSLYAADAGVGFARPGNRFWPAAIAAGVASGDRDTWHALRHHGTGFTDLVKRASVAAAELTPDELGDGFARVERLSGWLRPAAVCFLGVTGWRTATGDRRATPGWQDRTVGGTRAYVMHNPSGLNAHATVASLAAQLRAAAAG